MNKLIRVLVVDPFPVVRQGLVTLLEPVADLDIVAGMGDYTSTLHSCQQQALDVLVLGVVTPDLSMLEMVRQLKQICPQTKILVLAVSCDEGCVEEVIAAGVNGYLLKTETPSKIVAAIRAVARGETRFSQPVVKMLVQAIQTRPEPHLTQRQTAVLQLVGQGQTNAQIAQSLGISESTVRYHLQNIYRRLDVQSRTEAVIRAIRRGWL